MIAIQKPQGMAPKVLVVDDEEDIVTYLVAVLEDNGFRAVGESKATAVLDTIHKERPDLILLDIMMPGQSGLSLYRAIRKDSETADVPVFIISGYSQERDFAVMAGGLETQVSRLPDGYLEKPISISALLRDVHELFERQGNGG